MKLMIEALIQDLRFAVRCLRQSRSFTAAAVAALALGLGANTAIFSVVDAVMLRPLPYADGSRLVVIWEIPRGPGSGGRRWLAGSGHFQRWVERNRSLEPLAGWRQFEFTVTGRGEPERLVGGAVTPDFFRLFGARALLGRTFLAEQDRPGDDRVIVLSHGFWQRRLASDPGVLGRTLHIDSVPHTVIGVLEAGFHPVLPHFPRNPECYLTMSHTLQVARPGRTFTVFVAGGRLRPGITLAQAQADMAAVASGIEKEGPARSTKLDVELVPLAEELSREARPAMLVLLGAVGCVLLICCANVANLLLTRATARQREISIRVVLGARQGRLVRQLLTESVLLAVAGGVAGMLLARWGVSSLVAAMPPGTLPRAEDIAVDVRVFAFGFVLSLLTGLLFGIVPAIEAAHWSARSLGQAVKEAGTAVAGGRGRRLRHALAVAEVSVALVLLTGAGLLVRSFLSLRAVDLGFRAPSVLTASLALPKSKYADASIRGEFVDRILERVQRVPGLEAAAVTNSIPLAPGSVVSVSGFEIAGVTDDAAAGYRTVTPGYFRIMGILLKKGRLFTTADAKGATVIVNEAFVRRYWPREPGYSQEPLGRGLNWHKVWREIVGVVGDIKFSGRKSPAEPEMYMPHTENIFADLVLVVRTTKPPSAIVPALRSAVLSVDRDQPLERIATMNEVQGYELAQPRFHMLLLVCFAAVALGLATVGIYGVIAYSVAQRQREIAIRMALGASSRSVLGAVLWEAGLLALAGVLVGITAAVATTRLLASFLFGVQPVDPVTFVAVAVLLVAVALLAAWIPARRAVRVYPMAALRYE